MGVIGWDSGGGNALDFAIAEPRIRALVVCDGRLTTDAEMLKPMKAAVLGIYAGKNVGITKETRDAFRAAMKKAGKELAGMHVYEDCDLGFLSDGKNADAVADAERKIADFFAAQLQRRKRSGTTASASEER
jgi:dienelactone hydrolase